jgi:hypothetical protein
MNRILTRIGFTPDDHNVQMHTVVWIFHNLFLFGVINIT